jgi:hypothetical protein
VRLAGSEYFKVLGVVNKFDKQRGLPALSDPLLDGSGSDPTRGSPPPGADGLNGSQAATHQHHRAHPSSDKPGENGQGQHDSSETSPAPSLHIRRGGLLDEVA